MPVPGGARAVPCFSSQPRAVPAAGMGAQHGPSRLPLPGPAPQRAAKPGRTGSSETAATGPGQHLSAQAASLRRGTTPPGPERGVAETRCGGPGGPCGSRRTRRAARAVRQGRCKEGEGQQGGGSSTTSHPGTHSRCRLPPLRPTLGSPTAGTRRRSDRQRLRDPVRIYRMQKSTPNGMQNQKQRTGLLVQTSVQARWGAGRGRAAGKLRSVQHARGKKRNQAARGAPRRGDDSN